MHSPIFGEFMGTMVLIMLGDGVVANVLLKKSKAEGSGWIVITAGWAFAVMAGIFTAVGGGGGADPKPAVTLGNAVRGGVHTKILPFVIAQLAGAMLGAAVVWVHYFPHWK